MKTKQIIKLLICILLLSNPAFAVEICQVLYDPSVESGGEAIELHNNHPFDADISGWIIATETSSSDAVIPANTTLKAGSYYLIADKGWDEKKDNSKWRSADFEEAITMNNQDSGIALMDSNKTTIDAVGWGDSNNIKQGLFEGTPYSNIKAGKALIRINDTDDNKNDFTDSEPDFFGKGTIKVEVNVSNSSQANSSLSILEGNRISPVAGEPRIITVKTSSQTTISFLGESYEVDDEIELELDYFLLPGNYTISSDNGKITFEYLSLKAYEIISSKIFFNAQPGKSSVAENKIKIKNTGNEEISLGIDAEDFQADEKLIGAENLKFSRGIDGFNDLSEIIIKPGLTEEIAFSLFIPQSTLPGKYTSLILITEE